MKVNLKRQLESHKVKKHQNRRNFFETMMKHMNKKHSIVICYKFEKLLITHNLNVDKFQET